MRADYVKSDAVRLLVNTMHRENGIALLLCLETGLRIGDALKIRWSDLDGCRLSYVAQKTGKAGQKTISKTLAKELRSIAGVGREFIFWSDRSGTGHRTRQAVYNDLKRAARVLGMQGQISPHSARKSYAVDQFKAHGLDTVKKELQHSNAQLALYYATSDREEIPIDDIMAILEEIAYKVDYMYKKVYNCDIT